MGISKVILNGVTQMDVTQKTVASNNLLNGETALGADGEDVVGSIQNGSAVTPYTVAVCNITSTSIDANGVITGSGSKNISVTPTVTPGYIANGTAGTIAIGASFGYSLPVYNGEVEVW